MLHARCSVTHLTARHSHIGSPPEQKERTVCLSPAGYSADQQGLLYVKRSIRDFDVYQRRAQCKGWVDQPGQSVCMWDGVDCNNQGKVFNVDLWHNGSTLFGESPLPRRQKISSGQDRKIAPVALPQQDRRGPA